MEQEPLDPQTAWARIRVPALLQYGTADERIDAPQSAARLRQVVGHRPGTMVRPYPKADHELMLRTENRPSAPGPWAWPVPAPSYLPDMLAWMQQRTRR